MSAGQATAGRIPLLRQPLYRRFLAARTISLFGDQVSALGIPLAAILVLHASAWFFLAIKLAGAAYLIWLAIQLWRSDAPAIDTTQEQCASLATVAQFHAQDRPSVSQRFTRPCPRPGIN